jgi:hypothetical protein
MYAKQSIDPSLRRRADASECSDSPNFKGEAMNAPAVIDSKQALRGLE